MWTVIHIAQGEDSANRIKELLKEHNIIVKLNEVSKTDNNNKKYYEIIVPDQEVDQAHSVILDSDV